jgi:hypothetical protein
MKLNFNDDPNVTSHAELLNGKSVNHGGKSVNGENRQVLAA